MQQLQMENSFLATAFHSFDAATRGASATTVTPPSATPSAAVLPTSPRSIAAVQSRRASVDNFTIRRHQMRREEDRVLQEEAISWLESVMGLEKKSQEALLEDLQTGVLLCDLVMRIDPQLQLTHIHRGAKPALFLPTPTCKRFARHARSWVFPTTCCFPALICWVKSIFALWLRVFWDWRGLPRSTESNRRLLSKWRWRSIASEQQSSRAAEQQSSRIQ